MRLARSVVLILAAFGAASPSLLAQAGPSSGTARVSIVASKTTLVPAQQMTATVWVDLSGVTGTNGGARTPAVLGAYQISITFDPAQLRLDTVTGGLTQQFAFEPTSTNPVKANAEGKTTIVGSQTDGSAPTGKVSVARLTFSAIGSGTTALGVTPVSLSSAFQIPGYGPVLLPATGSSVSVVISTPDVPTDPNDPGVEPTHGRRHPVRNPRFHPLPEGSATRVTIVAGDGAATVRIALRDRLGAVLEERDVELEPRERREIDPRTFFPSPWPDGTDVVVEVVRGTATIEG